MKQRESDPIRWRNLRLKVFKRDNYTCHRCKKQLDASELIADHKTPIALGGKQWDMKNVQTSCVSCDKIKTKNDLSNIGKERISDAKIEDLIMKDKPLEWLL